jgi:hypothetical protein
MMPPEFGDGRQGYAQTGESAAVVVASTVITARRTVIREDLDMPEYVCVCAVCGRQRTHWMFVVGELGGCTEMAFCYWDIWC